MASALKGLSAYDETTVPDGADLKIGLVVAEYHTDVTHALFEGARDTLLEHGVPEGSIYVSQVPGAFELPAGARLLAGREKLDAVVCLGCVIKGETDHDVYINQSVATALQNLSIASGRPFIFGLLTPNTHEQARARAGGEHGNKGVECAVAALRMAALKKASAEPKKGIGFG